MEKKLDLKHEFKRYYHPAAGAPEIVDIPGFQFLMIDGLGMDFENGDSQNAIQALFAVSFKVKFLARKAQGTDYVVMPLEGLWWADDPNDFIKDNRERWCWTYMILQPEWITADLIHTAIQEVKKSKANPLVEHLRLENYHEGLSSQIMHIGPFAGEHPNIMKIHQLIAENGGSFDGKTEKHHEIYLSDFRKTAPEKLKTVLRQPFFEG
ncbi:MAG TPA: hypothetical protein DDW50_08185 [Firmicutes bacterium]|jgi:hypothetical protein|nr:hypothetical protein [Bacillota bacterium]